MGNKTAHLKLLILRDLRRLKGYNKKPRSFVQSALNLLRVLSNVLIIIIVKMQTIKAVSAHLMKPPVSGPRIVFVVYAICIHCSLLHIVILRRIIITHYTCKQAELSIIFIFC